MRAEHDAMMLVRADLCERLDSLQRFARTSSTDFSENVAIIRRTAAAYGLTPVVRLAEAMERAMSDDHPWPASLYLDRLHDAIGCERADELASQAMLASISVRLGG